MSKGKLIIGTLIIGAIVLSSCKNPKRRLPGTWESRDNRIDGKNELIASDQAGHILCGGVNASMKITFEKITLKINKDESYQAEIRSRTTLDLTYDACPKESLTKDTTINEEGTWTLVDKTKIRFMPKDGKQYECEIVELSKTKLQLKCPCVEDCSLDILGDGDVDYTIGDWEFNGTKL